ncbi:tubulin polyglutamylase complex subunit 2 [Cylas formicarius]|uniref:tubulin polyglutamylase complex subunit 2 n=1 Tax=Cylas formicarius TaxID=197179 RepID=UPI0029589F92|nr:tubulin polyglutamylase complex subunit 2 [Cylas formicarius]
MGFVVDKVSEDSFYENLLLGVPKVLERCPCVSNATLARYPGVRQAELRAWEHNNGVILPEDLRAFYSSTNGFLYTYDFSYDYQGGEGRPRTGKIAINPVNELVRVYGYETKGAAQIEGCSLTLSRESKVFELVAVDGDARVVLVYPTTYAQPSVWLYHGAMSFAYLAEDFTTYFRMCIAHLGVPCWEYAFSNDGLPEWSREIFTLMAPGVLLEDRNLVEAHRYDVDHVNVIDHNIFSVAHPNPERVANVRPADRPKDKGKNASKRAATARTKK